MRSNRNLRAAAVAMAAMAAMPAMGEQENVYRPARGFQPAGSYAVSQLESVNNVTGGITLRIPLAKVAGRNGSGLSLDLVYNSALYNLQTQQASEDLVMDYVTSMGDISLNMLNVSNGGGWRYSHRYSLDIDSRGGTVPGTRLTLVTGDGGSHPLWLRVPVAGQNDIDGFSQFDITGTNIYGTYIGPNLTYYTTDGSFIRVEVTVGSMWAAYFPNGDYVSGPIVGGNNPKDADQICDRNSNCVHIANTVDPSTLLIATTELADDFGRKVVVSYGNPSLPSGTDQVYALPYGASINGTWGDPRNQANPLITSVQWNTISFGPPAGVLARNATSGIMYQCQSPDGSHSDWRCLNSFSLRMVSQIVLPNALTYDFTYADGSAGSEAGQGELREMKLPKKNNEADNTRATVHYYWSRKELPIVGTSPTPWFDANINPVRQKVLLWQEESDSGAIASSNTWTYVFGQTDANGHFTFFDDHSQVFAPDGGVTTHLFYNRTGVGAWNTGLVYKTAAPEGTTWRCWQKNEPWIGVSAPGDPKNPYVALEFRQLPGAANAAATSFDYDKNGNLISKREYDWVAAPTADIPPCGVAGAVLRKTENRYWNPAGGLSLSHAADNPVINLANVYWNTGTNRKRNSLLETRLYAGEESNAALAKALSQYDYDNPDTTGNVHHEYRWDNQLQSAAPGVASTGVTLSSANAAVTTREYGSGGLPTLESDPSSNVTQYTYGQVPNCPAEIANLYPTQIAFPEGHIRQYLYDCATGAVTSEIATSNRNLTTQNAYDRYGRVTSTTPGSNSPNPRLIMTEYNDSARQVRVVTDGVLGRVSDFNQLGALYLDRENHDDATGPVAAGSTADIRTVTVERTVAATAVYSLTSNPFLSGASPPPPSQPNPGWTLRTFDRAGRLTEVSYYSGSAKPAPFGSNTARTGCQSYSYAGDTTTVTERAPQTGQACADGTILSFRSTTVDALGRLRTASDSGGTATYGYDVLDNLTSVTMTDPVSYINPELPWPGPKTQTRTFTYSSLGRLLTAANPESGTTTYTYTRNGALLTKTDARNLTITYAVDGLNRVTKKDYTATLPATPAARYCYDGKKYEPSLDATAVPCAPDPTRGTDDYAEGALTHAVALSGGAVVSQTKYTAIDAQGRVTASVQRTSGMEHDLPFQYQYNTSGQLTAVRYPSGRSISYEVNGANRVRAVRDNQSSSYYLQQAAYQADGSFAGATLGREGVNWTETRQYNSRLQPCKLQVQRSGAPTALLALQWKHSAGDPDGVCEGMGSDNNGNVRQELLQYPSAGEQQTVHRLYGYDGANRVTSYSEPATGKGQNYGYDGFGNLWQNGAATGVPELRANGPSWYLMADGSVSNRLKETNYDGAGYQRQLSLISGDTNATYDGEGRLVEVKFAGVVAAYVYDAEGRRVKRTDGNGVATYSVYDAGGRLMAEYGGTASGSGSQYVVADYLGSTRMVVDGKGNCVARMDYAPYGAVVPRSGQDCPPWTSGPMFTEKEREAVTGLDYFPARYYSGAQGRWTSPDPFNIILDAESREQFDAYLAQPQNWNKYVYTWNNPLRYTDPTGEAVELLGDEEERKKALALIQRAVGNNAAASRLYINEVKDGNKTRYFVGIKGDAGDFAKMGDAAQGLASLVQHKSVVEFGLTSQNLARFGGAVTFEPGEAGNQNTRVLVNPGQMDITNYNLSPNSVLGASRWEGQNLRPSWIVRNFNPEIAAWHEFGHAWGYINGRPMSQTNADALGWENQMRQRFYGPLGPYNARRIRH